MPRRRLCDAWMETHNVRTLRFDFRDDPVSFKPGQFVVVADSFNGYKRPVRRAYSIASTPLRPDVIEITVKREIPGVMSMHLTELPVGAEIDVERPNGKYFYEPSRGKRILLLGAGSGIVPLYSIARYALEAPVEGALVHLFYSVRTPRDVIYEKAWEELARTHSNFKVHLTATRAKGTDWKGHQGRMSAEWIKDAAGDVSDYVAYICGPGPMVEASEEVCRQLALPDERVNTEKW